MSSAGAGGWVEVVADVQPWDEGWERVWLELWTLDLPRDGSAWEGDTLAKGYSALPAFALLFDDWHSQSLCHRLLQHTSFVYTVDALPPINALKDERLSMQQRTYFKSFSFFGACGVNARDITGYYLHVEMAVSTRNNVNYTRRIQSEEGFAVEQLTMRVGETANILISYRVQIFSAKTLSYYSCINLVRRLLNLCLNMGLPTPSKLLGNAFEQHQSIHPAAPTPSPQSIPTQRYFSSTRRHLKRDHTSTPSLPILNPKRWAGRPRFSLLTSAARRFLFIASPLRPGPVGVRARSKAGYWIVVAGAGFGEEGGIGADDVVRDDSHFESSGDVGLVAKLLIAELPFKSGMVISISINITFFSRIARHGARRYNNSSTTNSRPQSLPTSSFLTGSELDDDDEDTKRQSLSDSPAIANHATAMNEALDAVANPTLAHSPPDFHANHLPDGPPSKIHRPRRPHPHPAKAAQNNAGAPHLAIEVGSPTGSEQSEVVEVANAGDGAPEGEGQARSEDVVIRVASDSPN
ncbi:hypothetical protein BJ912DRAFT_934820 [Pholiota molesta]|nr:hypothetical protein BJ912DRAFT_934820 [Pholiota molesta]